MGLVRLTLLMFASLVTSSVGSEMTWMDEVRLEVNGDGTNAAMVGRRREMRNSIFALVCFMSVPLKSMVMNY